MPNLEGDSWRAGSAYEDFMGRWSRPMAAEFIRWMDPPAERNWLDVGTGTGALVAAVCNLARPASVVACDPSAQFIESARSRMTDPRVTWRVTGAGALPRREGGYDAVVSGLALNFFPDPEAAVAEQVEITRDGGLVGAFVWDYAAGMEFLRLFWDAATEVDSMAAGLDEARRFPICRPDHLEALFRSSGARNVRVAPLRIETVFASFEDYWRPFLGGTGPAPSFVATLSGDRRATLEAEIRRRLPIDDAGSIHLTARAWAVLGTVHSQGTP